MQLTTDISTRIIDMSDSIIDSWRHLRRLNSLEAMLQIPTE